MSKSKLTDCPPPTVINTQSSSGIIRTGDPWASSVLIVLRVRPLKPTLLVWSLADRTWSWERLRCLRAILLEVPLLCTVIASLSLFTWVPLGIFLRLFKNGSDSCYKSFHRFLFFCLSFPHIPCHNRLSEAVARDYFKTDLVHTPVSIAHSGYLEPTE